MSGGVGSEQAMPSLEQLLEAGEVEYAVMFPPGLSAQEAETLKKFAQQCIEVGKQLGQLRWSKGDPPKHGYYLAAWKRAGELTVSELWFNPDASPKWWPTRGYLREKSAGLSNAIKEVAAWAPLPDPPEVD